MTMGQEEYADGQEAARLFRGNTETTSRKERGRLNWALKDGLSTLCVWRSSRGFALGMDIETLRTKGSRRVGGSLRWEWRWQDEDVPSSLRLIGKDWPR